jgi:thioesterase domain-containing protein
MQSVGPYRLLGHSFGGVVAYEIASQLRDCGESIEFIGLLDSYRPIDVQTASQSEEDVMLLASYLRYRLPLFESSVFDELLKQGDTDAILQICKAKGLLDSEYVVMQLQKWIECRNASIQATSEYSPRRLDATVHLFTADEADTADPFRGWAELLGTRLSAKTVPGDHYSMLRDPHIQQLALAISSAIRESTVLGTQTNAAYKQ